MESHKIAAGGYDFGVSSSKGTIVTLSNSSLQQSSASANGEFLSKSTTQQFFWLEGFFLSENPNVYFFKSANFNHSVVRKVNVSGFLQDFGSSSDVIGSAFYESISDWLRFDSFFRVCGLSGSFPGTSQGRCTTGGNCKVWDFTLKVTDIQLKNTTGNTSVQNEIFVNGSTCPSAGVILQLLVLIALLLRFSEMLWNYLETGVIIISSVKVVRLVSIIPTSPPTKDWATMTLNLVFI